MTNVKDAIKKLSLEELQGKTKDKALALSELSEEQILEVVELLKDIEGNNGFLTIAQTVGTSLTKVKEVQYERLSRISELTPEKE